MLLYSLLEETNEYVVEKTAMYGSGTYGPYGSYQEALEPSKELKKIHTAKASSLSNR